jgi:hypothetical protein
VQAQYGLCVTGGQGGKRLEKGSEHGIGNKLSTAQRRTTHSKNRFGCARYVHITVSVSVTCTVFTFAFGKLIRGSSVPYRGSASMVFPCKTYIRSLIAPPRQDDNVCGLHVKLYVHFATVRRNSLSSYVVASDHPALASYRISNFQAPLESDRPPSIRKAVLRYRRPAISLLPELGFSYPASLPDKLSQLSRATDPCLGKLGTITSSNIAVQGQTETPISDPLSV